MGGQRSGRTDSVPALPPSAGRAGCRAPSPEGPAEPGNTPADPDPGPKAGAEPAALARPGQPSTGAPPAALTAGPGAGAGGKPLWVCGTGASAGTPAP